MLNKGRALMQAIEQGSPEPTNAKQAGELAGHNDQDDALTRYSQDGHDGPIVQCKDGEFVRYSPLLAAAPDLLEACKRLLNLIDGLPWHTRDAVYKAFNERTGGLPGTLPAPIAEARAAITRATKGGA